MYITRVHFRAFDREHAEFYITDKPMMEKAIKDKLKRTIADTSLLKKVIRYEAVDLKTIQEDEYDMYGKRITPDING